LRELRNKMLVQSYAQCSFKWEQYQIKYINDKQLLIMLQVAFLLAEKPVMVLGVTRDDVVRYQNVNSCVNADNFIYWAICRTDASLEG